MAQIMSLLQNQNQKIKLFVTDFSITEKTIREAIEHNGAKTVDDIKELTYAGVPAEDAKGTFRR